VLVLDATGRKALSAAVGGSSVLTLDIEDLTSADYFLQVFDVHGMVHQFKLIKQ